MVISVLLLLSLLILIWLFPSSRLILTILFLLCGFVLASFPVVEKHRQAYLQGKISRYVYIRNILFDVAGILLALILAGLLGRYIAQIATEQISHDLTKLIVGIMMGLVIGLAVGTFVKQAWGHLVRTSLEN
jgi:uncharacterized protein YacL